MSGLARGLASRRARRGSKRMSGLAAVARRATPLLAAGVLLAGCAKADKKEASASMSAATASTPASSSSSSSSMHMASASSGGGVGAAAASGSGKSQQDMSVMGMEGKEAGISVDGIKPVPTQTLGTATWEGMKITAQAMTAVPFVVYDGTSERVVKPHGASFHLMVFLDDAHTGVVIPYAGVWATIRKQGKIVFDARQWPMLARYMGPHYGNDVTVPGAGTYQLNLLISPPVSARHVEYKNVWLGPHEVSFTFHWKPV